MKLYRFELRKLLGNKRSIIFIALLTIFYVSIGIGNSLFTFSGDASFEEYSELADDVTGPIKEDMANTSSAKIDELLGLLGNSHQVQHSCAENSESKLNYDYYNFAGRVDTYYNGNSEDDPEEPTGVLPLKAKLQELDKNGKKDSYQYKKLQEQLDTMTELGAPEFKNVVLWESLFEGWNGIMLLILLFFPITFLISSVYTKESSTGMDNLILSSVKGRVSIVLAKLGASATCSLLLAVLYFSATFIGNFAPYMSFEGAGASVRCLSFMSGAQFDMSILSFAFITFLWTSLAALVFGCIVTLFSSLCKNHAVVFGFGIILLLLGIIVDSLGTNIVEKIQLLVDFSFEKTLSVSTIFGSATSYNILGAAIPYWICAAVVFVILGIVSILALFRQQKRRSIA